MTLSPSFRPAPCSGHQPSSRPDAARPAGESALRRMTPAAHHAHPPAAAGAPSWRLSGRTASPNANAREVPWPALLPVRGNPSRSSPASSPVARRKSQAGTARDLADGTDGGERRHTTGVQRDVGAPGRPDRRSGRAGTPWSPGYRRPGDEASKQIVFVGRCLDGSGLS
jgi:hypothetical protein